MVNYGSARRKLYYLPREARDNRLMTHHLDMTLRPELRLICTYSVACSAEEYCGKVVVEAHIIYGGQTPTC